ncbi:MAG: RNA-protein complex protein Nop10 [Candidatus Bathyarchaeia archaeon]
MVRWLLRRCDRCGRYTLRVERCPYCGGEVQVPHPARFSIDDKYARYRRMLRRRLYDRGAGHHPRAGDG